MGPEPERGGYRGRAGARHTGGMEPTEPEGGEPACFLNLVCEECGKVRENGRCPLCGPAAEASGPASAREDEG